MSKAWKVILTISIAINLVLGYLLYRKPTVSVPDHSVYIEKIDSLGLVLDSLKECRYEIREKIDTVYIKIKDNNKVYEEARNTILNNSVDDDLLFFIDYLKRNKSRLDSIDHP